MRALILCAGVQARFGGAEHKQLLDFDGERLLHRTVRQWRTATGFDPVVVANYDDLRVDGCLLHRPEACRWTCETLLSTRPLWGERTVALLGDVRFTDAAVKRIASFTDDLGLFTDTSDFFALSFAREQHDALARHLELVVRRAHRGRILHATVLELYREMGAPEHLQVIIGDQTQDFDRDYEYGDFHRGKFKNVLYAKQLEGSQQ